MDVREHFLSMKTTAKSCGKTKAVPLSSIPVNTHFGTHENNSIKEKSISRKSSINGIGTYDGSLEQEPESAQSVSGESADLLALNSSPNTSLKDFEIGRPLGKGRFGSVYMVRTKREPKYILVLKCLYKSQVVLYNEEKNVRREIEIQSSLKHPNILRLFGYFHDEQRVFLMLEFAGKGTVFKQLVKLEKFCDNKSSRYISQVASALEYLHGEGFVHRDIKPENLLIDMKGQIKICDFGASIHESNCTKGSLHGTIEYMSPEMVQGKTHGKPVDIWSIGILAYEFLVGRTPFEKNSSSTRDTFNRIANINYVIPTDITKDASDFIVSILVYHPEERPSLDAINNHDWIMKHKN